MSGSIYLCFTIFCASVIIRLEVLFLVLFQFFADGCRHIDDPVCHRAFIQLSHSFVKILYISGNFIEIHGIIGTEFEKAADNLHGGQIVLADGGCILMELFCLFDGFFPDLFLIPYMDGTKQLLHLCFF